MCSKGNRKLLPSISSFSVTLLKRIPEPCNAKPFDGGSPAAGLQAEVLVCSKGGRGLLLAFFVPSVLQNPRKMGCPRRRCWCARRAAGAAIHLYISSPP